MVNEFCSLMFTLLCPFKISHPELFIGLLRSRQRTYVDKARLRNLIHWCRLLRDSDAAFVECGVGKGGCVALMSYMSKGRNAIWAFDSFEGMPALTSEDEGSGQEWVGQKLAGDRGIQALHDTFSMGRLDISTVNVVKGFFEDTLVGRRDDIGPIAILRLDNDWYKSTKFCLETLYDQVIPGGVILIDDYGVFTGCRKAVDEFRDKHKIDSPLIRTPNQKDEFYWIKT